MITRSKTLNSDIKNKANSIELNPSIKETNVTIQDNWFDDRYLKLYFDNFSTQVLQHRNDVLFFDPTLSQHLQFSNLYDTLSTLTTLSFDKTNIAFFCVNNYNNKIDFCVDKNNTNRGSHWSLLVYTRRNNTFHHFDSVHGLNSENARRLAKNVNDSGKFVEKKTFQQINSFECGLQVLVNTQQIIFNMLNLDNSNLKNLETCTSIEHVKQNHCEDNQFHEIKNKFKKSSVRMDFSVTSKLNTKFNLPCKNRFSLLSNDSLEEDNLVKYKLNKNYAPENQINEIEQHNSKKNCILSTNKVNYSKKNLGNSGSGTDSILNVGKTRMSSKVLPHNVKILSDSHGRNIKKHLKFNNEDYTKYISIKPNGKLEHVLQGVKTEVKNMNKNDVLIILGGTNDISIDVNEKYICDSIEKTLKMTSHTNVVLSAIPFRYDYPHLNRKIRNINVTLNKITKKYSHVSFLQLYSFNRTDYTTNGLHFNYEGKKKYCNLISDNILNITIKERQIAVLVSERNVFLDKRGIMQNPI